MYLGYRLIALTGGSIIWQSEIFAAEKSFRNPRKFPKKFLLLLERGPQHGLLVDAAVRHQLDQLLS